MKLLKIFRFFRLLSACTMDIIAKCAFATNIDCQHNPDDLFFTYAKRANTITFKDWNMIFLSKFNFTICLYGK